MAKRSAGLLMYRCREGVLEVFLVHSGGPLWARRDLGAWSIPKGEYPVGEDPFATARREFREETGFEAAGECLPLGALRQRRGKTVTAWAFQGDCDPADLRSNTFRMEWPRGSGQLREFPEVDRGEWFPVPVARTKIHPGQLGFLDALAAKLGQEIVTAAGRTP